MAKSLQIDGRSLLLIHPTLFSTLVPAPLEAGGNPDQPPKSSPRAVALEATCFFFTLRKCDLIDLTSDSIPPMKHSIPYFVG